MEPYHSAITPSTRQHLVTLRHHAHGVYSPFVCEGTFSPEGSLKLVFERGYDLVVTPCDARVCDALAWRCKPAPFGQGSATRYDRNVRDALQLNAARGALAVRGFDPAASGVLEAVRAALCPDDPNPLTAELYSLNLYSGGGYFLPHKDTPRGEDMVGTLVLALSRDFSGGDLVLTHRGVKQSVSWGGAVRAEAPTSTSLPWAAFFGDVDHEVTRVHRGSRVTLTWILRRTQGLPRITRPPVSDVQRFTEVLRAAITDGAFFTNGGTLAFACFHQYAETPGFVRGATEITAKSVLKLKGRDQSIAAAAIGLGLSVRLVPYLREGCADEKWSLARYPSTTERAVFRQRRLTPDDLAETFPSSRYEDVNDTSVTWVVTPRFDRRGERGTVPVYEFLGEVEFSATGYFGNEGGPSDFYLYAAIVVDVPSFTLRSKVVRDANQSEKTAKKTKALVSVPKVRAPKPSPAGASKPGAKRALMGRELMMSELRIAGFAAADVKRMLTSGELERVGFGWYRFAKSP
jgi:hypothetical protein